jgi:hypothetical protein
MSVETIRRYAEQQGADQSAPLFEDLYKTVIEDADNIRKILIAQQLTELPTVRSRCAEAAIAEFDAHQSPVRRFTTAELAGAIAVLGVKVGLIGMEEQHLSAGSLYVKGDEPLTFPVGIYYVARVSSVERAELRYAVHPNANRIINTNDWFSRLPENAVSGLSADDLAYMRALMQDALSGQELRAN